MGQIRVLIVDDHQIVRQGIRSLLSNYPEFDIVGEAEDGEVALRLMKQLAPDVILLDIRMPGQSGLDILKQIRQIQPNARVLMLTSFDDDEYVMNALKSGARGFVLKSVSDEMLVNAIQMAFEGERVLSPKITEQVVQRLLSDSPEPAATAGFNEEEKHILRMLVDGASNSDIANELYMSNTTVKRKLRKIFTKLNVQARSQAAAEAVRRGIV